MSIQYKFFIIPVGDISESEAELNRFLRSVRVINIQREFIPLEENSYWTLSVEYLMDADRKDPKEGPAKGRRRIDYRKVLSPEDFAIYAKLREWRNGRANDQGIPIYAIFTNEQLAKIAEKRVATLAEIRELDGVGDSRVKNYGTTVLEILAETTKRMEQKKKE